MLKHRRGNDPISSTRVSNDGPDEAKLKRKRVARKQSLFTVVSSISSRVKTPYLTRLLAGGIIGLSLGFLLCQRHEVPDLESSTVLHIAIPQKHSTSWWDPPQPVITASKPLFSTLPDDFHRTYYVQDHWACQAAVRALRQLGWTRVAQKENARLIYTNDRQPEWEFEPWQRYNHIPEPWQWEDSMARDLREYTSTSNHTIYFLPAETYNLSVESEVQEFRTRLFQHEGINYPWLLQQADDMDVPKILNPNSEDLKNVFQKLKEDQYTVQQHVCNTMTWKEQQDFNIRNYWFVASLDPLIVLYMDGYVRVGNNAANKLSITHNHETKASFSQLEETIKQRHETDEQLQTRVVNPMIHVRNQCKEALSHLIDAFKEKNFERGSARDAFELYSATFIVDNDLDVWLLDAHDDLDMDDDYYFLAELHHQLSYGMATALEEIWDKQQRGLPILPLLNTGQWQVIYANEWMFEYDEYQRWENQTSCGS